MAKPCKYGCKMLLEWDTEQSLFKEVKTGVYHDKRRCTIMKEKVNIQPQEQQNHQLMNTMTIPKGQFDQRGGESEYRRPIDDLLNQHHNALTQMYNNVNEKIDYILKKINEESEKSKELWRIVDATAAKVGVYKMHTGMDELRQRQQQEDKINDDDDDDADADADADVDETADPTDAIAYREQRIEDDL